MASWYADLATAVRAAVVAAWPETPENGIYHEMELAQSNFFRKQEDAELPLVAFGFSLQPSEEWGADNDADAGQLRIIYIAGDITMDALVAKLETMRDRLRDYDLTCGQVLGFPRIEFGIDLWTNQFILNAQRPNVSGAVTAQIVINTHGQ